MAEKRYIITADTSQAVKNVKKFADVLNNVSELPESFQKNMYNALNKAQKDVVRFGNDTKKLGVVFSSLSQTIQKNLDFLNKDMLPKEVVARFKDLEKSLSTVASNMEIVSRASSKVEKDTGSLVNKITQYASKLNSVATSAGNIQAELNKATNAMLNSNKAVSGSLKTVKSISNNYDSFSNIANKLSQEIDNVTKNMYSLSTSEEQAKANLKALRVDAVMLSESLKELKTLRLDIENADKIKSQLQGIGNQIRNNETLMASNVKTMAELQKQYETVTDKVSSLAKNYEKLDRKMQAIRSRGGSISSGLSQEYDRTGSLLSDMKSNANEIQKAIGQINNMQGKLAQSTKSLRDDFANLKAMDIVDNKQLALMKNQVNLLNQQGASAQKALTDVRAFNVEMATSYDKAKDDNMKKLQAEMNSVADSAKNITKSITKLSSNMAEINKTSQSTVTSFTATSRSATSLTQSVINMSQKTGSFTGDINAINIVMKELSNQIEMIGNRFNSLSTKTSNAKGNVEVIRGELVKLADISKRVEEISIDFRNIKTAKQSIEDMKNRLLENVDVIIKNNQEIKKLQAQYDNNAKALSSLTAQYEALKNKLVEIKQAGGSATPELTNAMRELNNAIKNTNSSLSETAKRLSAMKTEQTKLTTMNKSLSNNIANAQSRDTVYNQTLASMSAYLNNLQGQLRAVKELGVNQKELNAEMAKQSGVLRLVGTQFRSLIYDLNAVRIAFVLLSSSTGIASAISVIADFDKSMARVKSLMIGAKEETGALNVEFQALKDTVMALGATTKFTAGQVAEGAVIITQAGYNAKESIDVLRPTLDLAVAGQIDMAEAADTLTKTISMFQKETTDAAHVADIYAAAVNYSQTNMSELANAMTYVGPVAETFGLTLEETAGYLAVLANNGVNASKAGTSLRQLMMNIQQPTAKAAQVLNAYGLNLKELQRQGMSSEEALRHVLTTLSEVGHLGSVVRVTALPAAEILGKSGEDVEQMLNNLKEVDDYAKKVAENNMNNLKDQFIQLVSAIQDTIIKFGVFTGGTDALTSALKNSADAIRSWNVDMADLLTDLMFLGGVLLAARGRWKNYSKAVKDAQNGQVSYTSIVGKAGQAITNFKDRISATKNSVSSYTKALSNLTLKTNALILTTKLLSSPFVAMAGEMIALTAVMWGVSKAVEYFTSSNNIDVVLANNSDLFEAAAKGGLEYKRALDAVAASARQMSEIQLAGKIEETSNEIEIVKKNLISSIKDIQRELSDIRRKSLEATAGGSEMVGTSRFLGITDEQFDIIMETTSTQLPILDNLIQAVRNGASEEEIAGIMADLDPNAIEKLGSMLGVKGLNISLGNIDKTAQDMKALKDELKAMQGEMENKALAKLKVDLRDIIDKLTLIKDLSKTSLKQAFAGPENNLLMKIKETDKFIPIDSFRELYNEILKIENGGKELASVLDFSQEKGFFFNKGNLETELEVLRKELEDAKKLANFYERRKDEEKNAEYLAKSESLKKFITMMESYGTSLDSLNQSAFQVNFLKIWQEASNKINTDKMENIAESIFKITEATDDFRENFAKNMGVDFLNIGKQMGLLGKGDIELGKTFEDIRIDSQPVYDYVNAMKEKMAVDLEADKISEQQYQNALKYLNVLPELMKASYDKSQGKNRRKREDDFKLIFLQSEVAIGNATDALNGYNEQLLKTYELEKRMKDLEERNPKETSEWYKKAFKSLERQRQVIQAQMKAMAYYEKQSKSMADTGKLWGAMGIDSPALEVHKQYITMLEKERALETASNDKELMKHKNFKAIIEDMTKQYELEQQLYSIENQRYMLTKQSQIASMKKENNQMSSGGWLQNQRDWKYTKEQFNAEIEMVNQQIAEVANKITGLASQTDLGVMESGELERLKLLRQELELRKENLELQKQMNNPGGFEGAKQAFREYAQTVGNDAMLVKDAFTQTLDSISSGLTEGLYAAMKQTEYNWEDFWDNIAKIFLQKAVEMTIMRGTSALMNTIFGAIGGAFGGTFGGKSGGGLNSSGAYGGGGIAFAAKGRVINSPTYLMDKGQTVMAGERGAEAIMPLTRLSSGELGIKSTGTGGNANYNNNDFSIHITTTGSSGNAEQDRKQALEMQKMVKLMVNQQIGEFNKREHRQGGMFYNRK